MTKGDVVDANHAGPGSDRIDSSQGAALGLVIKPVGTQFWLGTVDDVTNTLDIRKGPR